MNDLQVSVVNLAQRVLAGEFDDPRRGDQMLRDQVMRAWRGVLIDPPGPQEADAGSSVTVLVVASGDPPPPVSPLNDEADAPAGEPSGVTLEAGAACALRRKHAVFKRRGGACPDCGYNREAA